MQWGFYFDQQRCTGCYTCVIACKDWNDVPAGPASWRKVVVKEEGKYPGVSLIRLSIACNHCENPLCLPACPQGAITKEGFFGVVLVNKEKCVTGCRLCENGCPYGAPQFRNQEAKMEKCDLCLERIRKNGRPICVEACPLRALDAGPMRVLKNIYGDKRAVEGFPEDKWGIGPNIIFGQRGLKERPATWENRTSQIPLENSDTKVIPTGCPHDCAGSCLLKAHVKDGVIKRITTDDGPETFDTLQLRACAKGRAYRQRVYSPDRLKYPMKRVEERGEGRFERISWGEALDKVAQAMIRIKEAYGAEAILNLSGAGAVSSYLHSGRTAITRLLNMFGGQTGTYGIISFEGAAFAALHTFGKNFSGSDMIDLFNSRLIIMWGWNPAESISLPNASWYLAQAKEKGGRIIAIDPRFCDSAAALADQWIPIRPGTDTAMLIAMAYVIIDEGLQDQKFLDTDTVGFEQFREYCLGIEDDIPKTPKWAEEITGVPAQTIANLAREYATTKPGALKGGWAPGRTPFGEQFHRACATLAAMTGNIGIPGGDPGLWTAEFRSSLGIGNLPVGTNPTGKQVPSSKWADAILQGTKGGYPSDIKMVYCVASNRLNQVGNINKSIQALKRLEFIVVHEQFMTPLAKFADILLPVSTHFERNDILGFSQFGMGNHAIFSNRVIEPRYECKSDLEICSELAASLDIVGFNEKAEEQWLREFVANSCIPDYERFKAGGAYKYVAPKPYVALQREIEDLLKNPFPTPSGKIEISSERIAAMNRPEVLPAIPKYIDRWESHHHPLAKKYPLQMLTGHSKKSVNSVFVNLPWLQEIESYEIWINPRDAEARGINPGDEVKVFNDLGTTILRAKVTERIMPGVVNIDHGAWYEPDEHGVDRAGSVNVLCKDEISPGGAANLIALVEVERL